jgi:hypothetical protein
MIDPKWGFILNAIAVVATALLGLGWATVLPTKDAATLMTILSSIVTVANTILHGISAPTPGPIAKLMNKPAS